MDNWTVEMIGDTLGHCRYICTYETKDKETKEKIETFFKELMREKYGKVD